MRQCDVDGGVVHRPGDRRLDPVILAVEPLPDGVVEGDAGAGLRAQLLLRVQTFPNRFERQRVGRVRDQHSGEDGTRFSPRSPTRNDAETRPDNGGQMSEDGRR